MKAGEESYWIKDVRSISLRRFLFVGKLHRPTICLHFIGLYFIDGVNNAMFLVPVNLIKYFKVFFKRNGYQLH